MQKNAHITNVKLNNKALCTILLQSSERILICNNPLFHKNSRIINCPVRTRRNIVRGYTVEYATAALSFWVD